MTGSKSNYSYKFLRFGTNNPSDWPQQMVDECKDIINNEGYEVDSWNMLPNPEPGYPRITMYTFVVLRKSNEPKIDTEEHVGRTIRIT